MRGEAGKQESHGAAPGLCGALMWVFAGVERHLPAAAWPWGTVCTLGWAVPSLDWVCPTAVSGLMIPGAGVDLEPGCGARHLPRSPQWA